MNIPSVVNMLIYRGYEIFTMRMNGLYGFQVQQNSEIITNPEFIYSYSKDATDAGTVAVDTMYEEERSELKLEVFVEDYPLPESEEQFSEWLRGDHYEVPLEIKSYVFPNQHNLPAISKDEYKNRLHFYKNANAELENIFKRDLLYVLEVTDNPKADKFYSIAWERGHAYGFYEVYSVASNLVELIK